MNPMVSIIGPDQGLHPSQHKRKPSAETDYLDLQVFSQDRPSTLFGHTSSTYTSFDNAQPWFGGIYTYQSSKRLFAVPSLQKRAHYPIVLLLIALLPILAASVTAFLVLWYTPTVGLTCRHVPLLMITLLWIISTTIGHVTWKTIATGRYHWMIVLFKDTFIALPSLLLIFLMSSGIFNSCYCWSSVWSRGSDAYVQLEPDKDRKHLAETLYPAFVWGCLGFQAVVFWICLRFSKRGRGMMRKDEKTKMRDFWSVHRGVEGEEENQRRWGRKTSVSPREKGRASVSVRGSSDNMEMLPPAAVSSEAYPFLKR